MKIEIAFDNAKNALQYIFQVYFQSNEVNYQTEMHGEPHIPQFTSMVRIPTKDRIKGVGIDTTKKDAEKRAALDALEKLISNGYFRNLAKPPEFLFGKTTQNKLEVPQPKQTQAKQELTRRQTMLEKMACLNAHYDIAAETQLVRKFLRVFNNPKFPYLVEVEWEFEGGRGDLVFSSQPNTQFQRPHSIANVLIVEAKVINPNHSNKSERRKVVTTQMKRAVLAWNEKHPLDRIFGAVLTSDVLPIENISITEYEIERWDSSDDE